MLNKTEMIKKTDNRHSINELNYLYLHHQIKN